MRLDYKEFAPPTILAPIVDAFWSLSPCQISPQIPLLKYRVLPAGCVDLFCRFQRSSGERRIINPVLLICAPTDYFKLVDVNSSIEIVGVRFKPGEAFSVLRSSPLSLSGETVVAQDYSVDFAPLFNQLSTSHSTQQALNLLQRFVLERILSPLPENSLRVREAIRLLSGNGREPLRIADVADKLGVSERTLRRDISQLVGLSPKCLSRILRFQRTVASLRSSSPFDLCTTALNSGYADQAHFGREFQELAGLSPIAYLRSLSQ